MGVCASELPGCQCNLIGEVNSFTIRIIHIKVDIIVLGIIVTVESVRIVGSGLDVCRVVDLRAFYTQIDFLWFDISYEGSLNICFCNK